MALTIGAILALMGIAVAVYPFLRRRFLSHAPVDFAVPDPGSSIEDGPPSSDLLQSIYDSIRTLQLERELGNVPEGLYREQLHALRIQAAMLLRERELAQGEEQDWAIEEEVRVARAGLYRPTDVSFACPNCGRLAPAGVEYCQECEAVLAPSEQAQSPVPREGGPS